MPFCERDASRYVPEGLREDRLGHSWAPNHSIVGEASPRPAIKQPFLDSQKNGYLVWWIFRKRPLDAQPLAKQSPNLNSTQQLLRILPEFCFPHQQHQPCQGILDVFEIKQLPVGSADIARESPKGLLFALLEYEQLPYHRRQGKKIIFQVVQCAWRLAQQIPHEKSKPTCRLRVDGLYGIDQRLAGRHRPPCVFAPEAARASLVFNSAKLDFQGIGTQATGPFNRQNPCLGSKFVGGFPLGAAASPRLSSVQLLTPSKYSRYFDGNVVFQKHLMPIGRLKQPVR